MRSFGQINLARWGEHRGVVDPPIVAALPSISGPLGVGEVLTAIPGSYPGARNVGRQWTRDGIPIPDATGSTHTQTEADIGPTLAYVETASNSAGVVSGTSNSVQWTPELAGTLISWLKPREDGHEDGADVLTLVDHSGNGIDFTAPTSANQGVYSSAARGVVFGGVDDWYEHAVHANFNSLHNTPAGTIAALVVAQDDNDTLNTVFTSTTSTVSGLGFYVGWDDRNSDFREAVHGGRTTSGRNASGSLNGTLDIGSNRLIYVVDALGIEFFVNAVSAFSRTWSSSIPLPGDSQVTPRIGLYGTTEFAGYTLIEHLVYATTLDATNRANLDAYLAYVEGS